MPEKEFKDRLNWAMSSPTLAQALDSAVTVRRQRRDAAFTDIEEFAHLQKELKSCKQAAIEKLPELIDQFTTEAEKAGAIVHFADTAQRAREIIGDIASSHNARLITKVKSMTSEEVELNHYLEKIGIEVVETDVGAWIIQLAGDRPTHMTAPAIHKTVEEIAELFSEIVGEKLPLEPNKLVEVTRSVLRRKILSADIGISGANIAIADTGTIVIVTNEGNGMLTTTLPPVHIALVGIEKIVPSLDDAATILKLLSRSNTGRRMSAYTSFITGPSRTTDIELSPVVGMHGPREVHIVLLDNGRSAMARDPLFNEALRCIRCAACVNVCPAFQTVGPAFGYIYTGPIGMPSTWFHHGVDYASGPLTLCTQCNACDTVCPSGIPLARLIVELRERLVEKEGLPLIKKAAFPILAHPKMAKQLVTIASRTQGLLTDKSNYIRIPFTSRYRNIPALAREQFRHKVASLSKRTLPETCPVLESEAKGLTILFYPGCVADFIYPEMAESAVGVLETCGVNVIYPNKWPCCGEPSLMSGDRKGALDMARQTITALEELPSDYVVSPCPSCIAAIVYDYPRLFEEDAEWLLRAEALAKRAIDFTSFIDRVAKLPAGALSTRGEVKVTYHACCHSSNLLGVEAEPYKIMGEVMKLGVTEMRESTMCCGFGGYFSFQHPEVAARIARHTLRNIAETGVDTVVTDNPGCIIHLRGAARMAKQPVCVIHIAQLMAERLEAMKSVSFQSFSNRKED